MTTGQLVTVWSIEMNAPQTILLDAYLKNAMLVSLIRLAMLWVFTVIRREFRWLNWLGFRLPMVMCLRKTLREKLKNEY
jgi:hypothetical protein